MGLDPETQVQLLEAANLVLLLGLVAVTAVPAALREAKAVRQDLRSRKAAKLLRRQALLAREVQHRQEMRERRRPASPSLLPPPLRPQVQLARMRSSTGLAN